MKRLVFWLSALAAGSPLAAQANATAEECQDLLKNGLRISAWEQHCQFQGGVGRFLRAGYQDMRCHTLLTDSVIDQAGQQIEAELSGQIRQLGGEQAFCAAARPAYEDIRSALPKR